VISGRLASPTPPGGGESKERGDEENATQSRGHLQGAGGCGGGHRHKPLAELAEHFCVPTTQITEWKQHLLAQAADVFVGTTSMADTPDLKTLHAKIGQWALENDFLAHVLSKAGLLSAKR
jgi:hypothetical protein